MECKGFAQQRALHGMTQEDLAKRLGVSTGMIGRVESGSKTPPLWMLKSAAELFDCTIDELVYGSGGRKRESA